MYGVAATLSNSQYPTIHPTNLNDFHLFRFPNIRSSNRYSNIGSAIRVAVIVHTLGTVEKFSSLLFRVAYTMSHIVDTVNVLQVKYNDVKKKCRKQSTKCIVFPPSESKSRCSILRTPSHYYFISMFIVMVIFCIIFDTSPDSI